MKTLRKWLKQSKFEAALLTFLLLILPPLGLYAAAQQGSRSWIWGLLLVVVLGNLLALGVK